MINTIQYFLILLIGASIGSFINVIVSRFPRNLSVVFPRSHCPKCSSKIFWFDNFPIISWILLRGKCRSCKDSISITYPIIESLTAFLFLFSCFLPNKVLPNLDIPQNIFLSWSLISVSIPLFILDIKYLWLPKSLILSGSLIAFFATSLYSINESNLLILTHLTAGLTAFIIFTLFNKLGHLILKKDVIGSGDIKLISMFGLWLGLKGILLVIYLSFLSSGIICIFLLTLKFIKRGDLIPFGPFIIVSGLSVWFFGNDFYKLFTTF